MNASESPHTEGLDEAIDDILQHFGNHVWDMAQKHSGWNQTEAKTQIKALLAETKKPPKELSSASRSSTEVDTSIVPNIDEALDNFAKDVKELNLRQKIFVACSGGLVNLDVSKQTIDKLESLIESTVLSVIGEDNVDTIGNGYTILTDTSTKRNQLRAEQRSKLGRLLEGEK